MNKTYTVTMLHSSGAVYTLTVSASCKFDAIDKARYEVNTIHGWEGFTQLVAVKMEK